MYILWWVMLLPNRLVPRIYFIFHVWQNFVIPVHILAIEFRGTVPEIKESVYRRRKLCTGRCVADHQQQHRQGYHYLPHFGIAETFLMVRDLRN